MPNSVHLWQRQSSRQAQLRQFDEAQTLRINLGQLADMATRYFWAFIALCKFSYACAAPIIS